MAEGKKLFRSVSLERLSSPEQLDQVLHVTRPKGWLALLTLAGLIIVALIWGIFGSVPTKVQGMGIFISSEGLKDISAPTSGQINTLYVSPGDIISRGQVVARIAQPELITDISQAREKLAELRTQKEQIRSYLQDEMELQIKQNARKRSSLSREIENLQEQIENLEKRRENQKQLLNKGLITRQTFLSTTEKIQSLEQKISQLRNEQKQIPLSALQLQEEQKQQIRSKNNQIAEVKRKLQSLEERLEDASKVYSPHSGRILEVPVTEGNLVNSGTRIASLELADDAASELVAVIYVPAEQGKKIEPGMSAHLSPTTVKVQEDGSILGLVTNAGDFPATQEGMMRILRNQRLAEQLSQKGAPIEIFVSPIPSPDTYSGYQWTSSKGPDQTIRSGTMASGSILVDEQPPITLVIPWLKEHVLGIGS